jgi:hypothetical protein
MSSNTEPAPADPTIAFDGVVELLAWSESSGQGCTVKLGLVDREALQHFDAATKRSRARAGQRYRAEWIANGARQDMPGELMFCGANWSHQAGASTKFWIAIEDFDLIRSRTTRDQRALGGDQFRLTLRQLYDDETEADQAQIEMQELIGGPISKNAARLCQDLDFQVYAGLAMHSPVRINADMAAEYVRQECRIQSRALLDHLPEAARRFEEVKSKYLIWLVQGERGARQHSAR